LKFHFVDPFIKNENKNLACNITYTSFTINIILLEIEYIDVKYTIIYTIFQSVKALNYRNKNLKITPSNILLDCRGNIKLCDFGLPGMYMIDETSDFLSDTIYSYMAVCFFGSTYFKIVCGVILFNFSRKKLIQILVKELVMMLVQMFGP